MENHKEHPDHERARNSGRVSPDHGEDGDGSRNHHGPTPGHPTVIHDASEIHSAQVGPGGLADLVPPEDVDPDAPGAQPEGETNGRKE